VEGLETFRQSDRKRYVGKDAEGAVYAVDLADSSGPSSTSITSCAGIQPGDQTAAGLESRGDERIAQVRAGEHPRPKAGEETFPG